MSKTMMYRVVPLLLAGVCGALPAPLSGQGGGGSSLALGLSAGGGVVDNNRRDDAWEFGPVFGGRFEWSRGTSAAQLKVDVQPFRTGRTNQPGDFRAVYILPTYAVGSERSRIGLSLGMGVFDLTSEAGDEGRKVGFVSGLSGSVGVSRSLSVELGWKRIRDVEGIDANLYSVQLVQLWRF